MPENLMVKFIRIKIISYTWYIHYYTWSVKLSGLEYMRKCAVSYRGIGYISWSKKEGSEWVQVLQDFGKFSSISVRARLSIWILKEEKVGEDQTLRESQLSGSRLSSSLRIFSSSWSGPGHSRMNTQCRRASSERYLPSLLAKAGGLRADSS